MIKNPPANAGDARLMGSIPGSGLSLGEGNGNLLQYSCLGNPMARGTWGTTVLGAAKSPTRLSTSNLRQLQISRDVSLWLLQRPLDFVPKASHHSSFSSNAASSEGPGLPSAGTLQPITGFTALTTV